MLTVGVDVGGPRVRAGVVAATGAILAAISLAFGFAMIWYIWWLAAASFAAILVVAIVHTFNYDRDYYIPAEDVVRTEGVRARELEMV